MTSWAEKRSPNIQLRLIETEEERRTAKRIVESYHSYVPSYNSVGRRIDWLVMVDGQVEGMIGIGSATYPPCKDVLRRLGISKDKYRILFNSIANNWRFCMKSKIPNAGTQVLRQLREQAPDEWYKKYGDTLLYLMTFVAGGNNGAVYRADNWEMIGRTAGLPAHRAVSMKWDDKKTLEDKFVKPDGKNQKLIFFKALRPKHIQEADLMWML